MIGRVFVVAIERPLHAALGNVALAEADANRLVQVFEQLGYAIDPSARLLGRYATCAAVTSRLRTFRKSIQEGERAVVIWCGRGTGIKNRGWLDCWDTLPDDRPKTSLAIADLVAELGKSKAGSILWLLATPGIDPDELAELLTSTNSTALLASDAGEELQVSNEIPGGLWTALLIDGISGRLRAARDDQGRVTARSIHTAILSELPRLILRYSDSPAVQNPQFLGSSDFVIRQFRTSDDPLLALEHVRRIVLRSESVTLLKNLSDYRKNYTVPDKAGPASRRFVQRLASRDIRTELEQFVERVREQFGYRRKDLFTTVESDGSGSLRSPDFEFTIRVELDEHDSTRLRWTRELGRFRELETARSALANGGFGIRFDQLVFEHFEPVDIPVFVDRLEASPVNGVSARLSGDSESCVLTLKAIPGTITIHGHAVVFQSPLHGSQGGAVLLELLMAYLTRFQPVGPSRKLLSD